MGDLMELTTWLKHLHVFYKITSNALAFEVKAAGNAALGLSRKPSNNCDFWIVLGEGHQCFIKKTRSHHCECASAPSILSSDEYHKFWLTWSNGSVRLGRDGYSDPIVCCINDMCDMQYVTFSVVAQRNPVHWRFEIPPSIEKTKLKPIAGSDLQWVTYEPGQDLPEELLVGGFEKENLYIARATHRGTLTPGKYVRSLGKAYIPWGGQSTVKSEFELLCGFNGYWVPTCDDKIPVGALIGGYSEANLETLYIGRALHEGHLIPGKVAPSHTACYIPYKGREISVKKFEILVSPKQNDRCINKIFATRHVQADIEEYELPDSDYWNETDEENLAI